MRVDGQKRRFVRRRLRPARRHRAGEALARRRRRRSGGRRSCAHARALEIDVPVKLTSKGDAARTGRQRPRGAARRLQTAARGGAQRRQAEAEAAEVREKWKQKKMFQATWFRVSCSRGHYELRGDCS